MRSSNLVNYFQTTFNGIALIPCGVLLCTHRRTIASRAGPDGSRAAPNWLANEPDHRRSHVSCTCSHAILSEGFAHGRHRRLSFLLGGGFMRYSTNIVHTMMTPNGERIERRTESGGSELANQPTTQNELCCADREPQRICEPISVYWRRSVACAI